MRSHENTIIRMQDRVKELIEDFGQYVDTFDQAKLFTGPSLYFHFKTMDLLHQHSSATLALKDDTFIESLYATLTAWGMHRMGPGNTKLVEFKELKDSFMKQSDRIQKVESFHIWKIEKQNIYQIIPLIWDIISNLQVGVGKTKIVAGSKALHHLLPDLVPPIDREYTIRFFLHNTTLSQGDEKAFRDIYPYFHEIAISCQDEISSRLGKGMNTSVTKVIDNAIVGYGLKHLKK